MARSETELRRDYWLHQMRLVQSGQHRLLPGVKLINRVQDGVTRDPTTHGIHPRNRRREQQDQDTS